MRRFVKGLLRRLPPSTADALLERARTYQDKRYFKQGFAQVKCGNYLLDCPKHHPLLMFQRSQPYRDRSVSIVAELAGKKYPDGTIIDIGANIGDTAALIATYARNKLILVEASDYFFEILTRNVASFPNDVELRKAMVSDGSYSSGSLHHRGGTAYFQEGPHGHGSVKTERLVDIADAKTCFIKIDTDGYDAQILADSLEWLAANRPLVLFENWIRNAKDLSIADSLYDDLIKIGYEYFIVWDDPGFHIVSTTSSDVLKDLNRYLYKLSQQGPPGSIGNFDVLCAQPIDQDIYIDVSKWYRAN